VCVQGLGWPAVFYIFGSFGLAWNFAWQRLVADYPPLLPPGQLPAAAAELPAAQQQDQQQLPAAATQQQVAQLQEQQLQPPRLLTALQQQQAWQQAGKAFVLPRVRDLPWRRFFTNKPFLAIVMAHSAFGEHMLCTLCVSCAAVTRTVACLPVSGVPLRSDCCRVVLPRPTTHLGL
jgi:hypothetical protein